MALPASTRIGQLRAETRHLPRPMARAATSMTSWCAGKAIVFGDDDRRRLYTDGAPEARDSRGADALRSLCASRTLRRATRPPATRAAATRWTSS